MTYTFKKSCFFAVLSSPVDKWKESRYGFLLTLPFNILIFPVALVFSLIVDFICLTHVD